MDAASALRGCMRRAGSLKSRGGKLPPVFAKGDGGTVKKTFTPNIPQRRIKIKEEKDTQKEDQNYRRERSSSRGDGRKDRGRGRGRREYIQTSGALFGEGVAARPAAKRSGDSSYDAAAVAYKPVFKPSKLKTTKEIEAENQALENDPCDIGQSSSEDEGEDYLEHRIIRIPLRELVKAAKVKEETKDVKTKPKAEDENEEKERFSEEPLAIANVKIKTEPQSDSEDEITKIKAEVSKIEKGECDETIDESSATVKEERKEILEDDQLFLIRFPSRLPFEKPLCTANVDLSKPGTSTQTTTPEVADDTSEDLVGTELHDMKEGFVGKLQFMKSGDVRMLMGNMEMGLHCDDDVGFLQEAVSIKAIENADEITIIGALQKALIFYPVVKGAL